VLGPGEVCAYLFAVLTLSGLPSAIPAVDTVGSGASCKGRGSTASDRNHHRRVHLHRQQRRRTPRHLRHTAQQIGYETRLVDISPQWLILATLLAIAGLGIALRTDRRIP
jgi:hypothetical protein